MAATYESNEAKIDNIIDIINSKGGAPIEYRKVLDVYAESGREFEFDEECTFAVVDILSNDIVHTDVYPLSLAGYGKTTDYGDGVTVYYGIRGTSTYVRATHSADYNVRIRGYLYDSIRN